LFPFLRIEVTARAFVYRLTIVCASAQKFEPVAKMPQVTLTISVDSSPVDLPAAATTAIA
jgi:hypothetical protein